MGATSIGKTLTSGCTKNVVRASRKPGCRSCRRRRSSGSGLVGDDDVVDAQRVEDDARLEVDAEVAQVAEEVVVLPADEAVDLRLDLVELEAAAEADLSAASTAATFTVSGTTGDGGSDSVGTIWTELSTSRSSSACVAASIAAVEYGSPGVRFSARRSGASSMGVEDELSAPGSASCTSTIVMAPKTALGPGWTRERRSRSACAARSARASASTRGVRVAAVRQRARDGGLRLRVRVLVEARARREGAGRRRAHRRRRLGAGSPSRPSTRTLRTSVARPLVDDDLARARGRARRG